MSIQQHIKIAADAVVFSYDEKGLYLLLIERKKAEKGKDWAVPGGFIEDKETPEQAAIRELKEETGIKTKQIRQFHTFGEVKRDPRFRVISIAHYILMKRKGTQPQGNDDAKSAQWVNLKEIPELAFDHNEMVKMAFNQLQKSISSLNIDCIAEEPTLEDVKLISKLLGKVKLR
ncbi:NUDIX domain-containing protein [Brumimicrobium aurantiacum]|uniref:NUDIX hydrolase n=1 Tax=Brumimicrobium aurantiacum TaxID=1737063 RepID=A0A3E1EYY1_9FLAO|nr:NUDIX hydrolase [Brumimicrobium aurantiacum]RFC54667.1 NUDIX hydrolase [Brumimicrobium aurantiacum]